MVVGRVGKAITSQTYFVPTAISLPDIYLLFSFRNISDASS